MRWVLLTLQAAVAAARPRTGLRARDPNVPASTSGAEAAGVAPKALPKAPTGRSMSALLQSRSEAAAAASTSAAAHAQHKQQLQPQSPMPDIDSGDKKDPLAASEYVADIFSYYKRIEPQFRVSPSYMSRQVWHPVPTLSMLHVCMVKLQHSAPTERPCTGAMPLVCLQADFLECGLFLAVGCADAAVMISERALCVCTHRPTSTTACVGSSLTGWWRCTTSSG